MSEVSRPATTAPGLTELRPPPTEAMRRFAADGDGPAPTPRAFPPPQARAVLHAAVAVQLLAVDAACALVIQAAQRVRRLVAPEPGI